MENRELYRQKFEAQFREWSAKIEALRAHNDKLTAQAQIDAKPHFEALHSKLTAANTRLHEIADTTEDKWDDVKRETDLFWREVKGAVEGAYDALMPDKAPRENRPPEA